MSGRAPQVAGGQTLYVVATPVGNLRDITLRALDILAAVDVVAAEDTRLTGSLLRHHGISTRLLSLHEHNEAQRAKEIVALLAQGKRVALVSDAGTPAISDPGARLVRAIHDAGYTVAPLPGPCAVAAAVSAAGLDAERFVFLGFLPFQAGARRRLIETIAPLPLALVLFEAPHRVRDTVIELARVISAPRTLIVARELTKMHETITRMSLHEAASWFDADANRARGELVLILDAPQAPDRSQEVLSAEGERWLRALLEELPPARAARVVAAVAGAPRDEVYARALTIRPASDR